MKINIIKLDCKRCTHIWVPTKENIRICPKCKSPYWDVERKVLFKKHIIPDQDKWFICDNGHYKVCYHHPLLSKVTRKCYVHKLIMENHLGKYIEAGYVVHHVNNIKTDNRIENLELMTVENHISHHASNHKKVVLDE